MTRPFLPSILGANAAIAFDAAFGADLSDGAGAGWVWTDITADVLWPTPVTVGRADNVSQAPAAKATAALDNDTGAYTADNPIGVHFPNVAQNTPLRLRMTLDGVTWKTRWQGYADSFNPTTDPSAKVKRVSATGLGMLGRLAGRKKPLASALARSIAATGPTCWWPLEDVAGAPAAASAIAGVAPLRINTLGINQPPKFGTAGPPGAAGAVEFANVLSGLTASILPGSSATSWRFEISILAASDAGQLGITIKTPGDVQNIFLNCVATFNVGVNLTFADRTTDNFDASGTVSDGMWHRLRFDMAESGSATTYDLTIDGVSIASDTLAGKAFAQPTFLEFGSQLNGTLATGDRQAFSNATFCQPIPASSDTIEANTGHTGETADDRITRLCTEENIDLRMVGSSDVTMGAQSIDTIVNLLRECEAADHGLLYDGLGPGLSYQCRTARYGAPAVLILDMAAREVAAPFTPIFDRQAIKNLYKISRKDGATVTVERKTGAAGTTKVGVEDASATVNLDSDSQLPDHGAWLTTLGTVGGFRYPDVLLYVDRIPGKAGAVLNLLPGSRITIKNPASKAVDLPPDDIDLIVEGWKETTTADTYTVALNCSPYAPWRVVTLDDATTGRLDTAGSSLRSAVTAAANLLGVMTNVGPLWTVNPASYPLDLAIAGERVTALAAPESGCTVATVDGTAESGATAGWSANNAAVTSSAVHAHRGTRSYLLTAAGGGSNADLRASTTLVTPLLTYEVAAWVFSPLGSTHIQAVLDFFTAAFGFISESNSGDLIVPANTWTRISRQAIAPATTGILQYGVTIASAPAAGTLLYVDDIDIKLMNGGQTFPVRRSVNGIIKAHAAGEAVTLWRPATLAL